MPEIRHDSGLVWKWPTDSLWAFQSRKIPQNRRPINLKNLSDPTNAAATSLFDLRCDLPSGMRRPVEP